MIAAMGQRSQEMQPYIYQIEAASYWRYLNCLQQKLHILIKQKGKPVALVYFVHLRVTNILAYPCLSCSWGVHWHVQARRGLCLHAGGLQPLPHIPQCAVHEGPDSRAEGQHRRGQALVWGSPVHQPDARQDHAETGNPQKHWWSPSCSVLVFCLLGTLQIFYLPAVSAAPEALCVFFPVFSHNPVRPSC